MKFLIRPLYDWYRHTLRSSKYRWLAVVASLLYLMSPLDLVTDFLPIVGWIDDGIVATILVTEVSQLLLEQRQKRRENHSLSESLPDTV